jgi:hypothetical protein
MKHEPNNGAGTRCNITLGLVHAVIRKNTNNGAGARCNITLGLVHAVIRKNTNNGAGARCNTHAQKQAQHGPTLRNWEPQKRGGCTLQQRATCCATHVAKRNATHPPPY